MPDKKSKSAVPNNFEEMDLYSRGYKYIAGIDEAGRGCLAGPVVAAAVILPEKIDSFLAGNIRDSKKLTALKRDSLYEIIKNVALGVGVGIVSSDTIDEINILNATKRAMIEAVEKLEIVPDFLLLDGNATLRTHYKQKAVVKGDGKCISIACASVIAKVERDRMMIDYDREYPGYGFLEHKGYGTDSHMRCLNHLGPSHIHRKTFSPVKNVNRLI